MDRISDERWNDAQAAESSAWVEITQDVSSVLGELIDAAELVEFGRRHGVAGRPERVIELGVGPLGTSWGAFGEAGEVIGVDPLPQVTSSTGDATVDRLIGELQARTTYVQGDATQPLPFEAGSFDLVVCDNVVDHTQSPKAVLVEARRLARNGGLLLFGVNVFSELGLLRWRHVTRRLRPTDSNTICHPHSFSQRDIAGLLTASRWEPKVISGASVPARLVGRAYRVRSVARAV